MSRYLLFAGMDYYPAGGMADLRGAGDSIDELKELLASGSLRFESYPPDDQSAEWWHIFDLEKKEIVASDGRDRGGCSHMSYIHRWGK